MEAFARNATVVGFVAKAAKHLHQPSLRGLDDPARFFQMLQKPIASEGPPRSRHAMIGSYASGFVAIPVHMGKLQQVRLCHNAAVLALASSPEPPYRLQFKLACQLRLP